MAIFYTKKALALIAITFAVAFISLFSVPARAHAACNVTAGCTGQTAFSIGGFLFQGNDPLRLSASSSPTVGWIFATTTTATSTLQKTSVSALSIGSLSGLLKAVNGYIVQAVANTDYQSPITLTTTGSSGASTFNGTTLNIPVYSGGASSTLLADSNTFSGTINKFTNAPQFTSLTGLLKGNGASALTVAANGTDYSLISALTCGAGQHFSAVTASGTFTCSADTGAGGTGLSTTSPLSAGNLLVYSSAGAGSAFGVATGTVSAGSSAITVTAGRSVIGGALAIDCAVASGSQAGCLSTTDWNTFNNKPAFSFTPATYGAQAVNATTTGLWLKTATPYNLIASTTFVTYASTTQLSNSGNTYLTGLSAGSLYLGSGSIVASVATSAPTVTAPITYSGTLGAFVGGVGGTFGCTNASAGVTGCLTGTDWSTFNNKTSWPYTINAASVFYGAVSNSTTTQMHYGAAGYSLTASTTAAFNIINTGSSTATVFANAPLVVAGKNANYTQAVIQNLSNGVNASALLAIHADIGTDSTYYQEIGINSSGYSQATFSSQNRLDAFDVASDGALVIGTASTTNTLADLRFIAGGTASSSIRMVIRQSGLIGIGTTTPLVASLTIASTSQQLALTDGSNPFFFRAVGGNFYIASGTAASATTTVPALTIIGTTGRFGIASSSPIAKLSVDISTIISGWVFSVGDALKTVFHITSGGQVTTCETKVATSSVTTIDWVGTTEGSSCNKMVVGVGTAAMTIQFINATTSSEVGGNKLLTVCSPATTAGAITFVGVEWAGGTVPTQTTTANQCDVYSIYVTSATSTTNGTTASYKLFGGQSAGYQ